MIKEIKYNGYSATPSDYECPDGDLAGTLGVVPENGALHPVFPPTTKFSLNPGEQLLWTHKMNGHTHYILLNNNALYWVCEENGENDATPWTRHAIPGGNITGTPTLSSIGNTLVAGDDNGLNYFLWSNDNGTMQYVALGQKPPMLEITFGLHSEFAVWPDKKNTNGYGGAHINVGNIKNSLIPQLGANGDAQWAKPVAEMGTDYNNFAENGSTYSIEELYGSTDEEKDHLSLIKNTLTNGVFARLNVLTNEKGTKENKFVMPFFVRYAYRLYDNTYIMHSYPVLMIPNSRGPIFGLEGYHGLQLNDNDDNYVGFSIRGRVYGFLSSLVYSILSIPAGLEKWKDIITSIDIGVSAPIYTYKQDGTVFGWTNMDNLSAWDEYYSISKVVKFGDKTVSSPQWVGVKPFRQAFTDFVRNTGSDFFNKYNDSYLYPSYLATVPQRNISDINNDLTGATSFYIIKQFSIDELAVGSEQSLDLDEGTLGGLLSRLRIDDDFRTHDTLRASLMHTYNGRMNYAGIERTPHSPLNPAIQFPQANVAGATNVTRWQVAVTIKNDTQLVTVQSDLGYNYLEFPRWIYYPDANAKFAYLTKAGTTYKLKLTPHDHLNGAYWLANIMTQRVETMVDTGTLPTISTAPINEENKLYTSNVNNPFYFEPDNIKTIGYGKILGICSAAKAMSPSQFGQFPLYAFTDEGVWALEVAATGSFKPSQPFTRDVCVNPKSITQLDSTVLFATDRGIMMVSGSQSLCISDSICTAVPFSVQSLPKGDVLLLLAGMQPAQFRYMEFLDFVRDCRICYDYVHQRVIIYNPDCRYAYLYSLDSKQWGIMPSNIIGNPNAYPDALVITDDNKVVNYSKPDDAGDVALLFITRPIKLDYPDALKTVDTIIQRGYFRKGKVKSVLYGSRDLFNWHLVYSSTDHYLRGFRGTPYKYFRIALFGALARDESIYGCTVQYTPRHTNQPR